MRLVRDSNLSQFLILKKCQTVEQYWNWGKMKALYNFTLVAGQIIKVTKSWHYSVSWLLTFLHTKDICSLKFMYVELPMHWEKLSLCFGLNFFFWGSLRKKALRDLWSMAAIILHKTVFQPENSAWGPKWPLQPIFGGQIFQERANIPVPF